MYNKSYCLTKNSKKNSININNAIDILASDSTIKTLLYHYFETNECFNMYYFKEVINQDAVADNDDSYFN